SPLHGANQWYQGVSVISAACRCCTEWRVMSSPVFSRYKNNLARCLSSRQCPMCVCRTHQRELRPDLYFQFSLGDPREELVRALHKLLARGDVIVEGWPREKERALTIEDLRVECGNWSARLAEKR